MSELRSGGDLRPVLLICTFAAAGYAAYALLRHFHYWSALDTGIFNQAIWHYSNFEAPDSTVKGGLDLRVDHFHPILMLLAPLYWVADEPALLLVPRPCSWRPPSCPCSCSRASGWSACPPTR